MFCVYACRLCMHTEYRCAFFPGWVAWTVASLCCAFVQEYTSLKKWVCVAGWRGGCCSFLWAHPEQHTVVFTGGVWILMCTFKTFPFTSHECRWETVPNQASLIHLMRVLKMQSTCTKTCWLCILFTARWCFYHANYHRSQNHHLAEKWKRSVESQNNEELEIALFVWAGRTLITALAGCFFTAASELRLNNI